MIDNLGKKRLKSGEWMSVKRITAPANLYTEKILEHSYPGPDRTFNLLLRVSKSQYGYYSAVRCLKGDFQDRLDYFFIGEIKGEIAGLVGYTTSKDTKDLATLGPVKTKPEHRRKGIATILTRISMEHFKNEGGLAMYLGAATIASIIYRRLGFRSYPPSKRKGGIMRWVVPSEIASDKFDDFYFEYSPHVIIRKSTWADLPRFETLFNFPSLWTVRYYPDGIIGEPGYEGQFNPFMKRVEEGTIICRLLQNEKKRMVGMAALTPLPSLVESHIRILDFILHPNYFAHGLKLLKDIQRQAFLSKVKLLRCFVAENSSPKGKLLRNFGFEKSAKLTDQIKVRERKMLLYIYSKSLN